MAQPGTMAAVDRDALLASLLSLGFEMEPSTAAVQAGFQSTDAAVDWYGVDTGWLRLPQTTRVDNGPVVSLADPAPCPGSWLASLLSQRSYHSHRRTRGLSCQSPGGPPLTRLPRREAAPANPWPCRPPAAPLPNLHRRRQSLP